MSNAKPYPPDLDERIDDYAAVASEHGAILAFAPLRDSDEVCAVAIKLSKAPRGMAELAVSCFDDTPPVGPQLLVEAKTLIAAILAAVTGDDV